MHPDLEYQHGSANNFSALTDVTIEPTMLWDVNPTRNRFRTESWAEAMPKTARAASEDLCMMR
jgi:hypothetical protein